MVTAPDRQRRDTQFAGRRNQNVKPALDQPGPGQAHAIPHLGGGLGAHDPVVALRRHAACFQFLQIGRQQGEPMGVMAKQVTFDKCRGHHACGLRHHPGAFKQHRRRRLKILVPVSGTRRL